MGFLENALKKSIGNALGKAVGQAVGQAVKPKVDELTHKAAQKMEEVAQKNAKVSENTAKSASNNASQYEGAFGDLKRSLENFATQASKNMKICPSCGQTSPADKKFCPNCGEKLPEETLSQGSLCPKCGTQNPVGTKFCQECGEKLPAAVAEEKAAEEKKAAVLDQWSSKLPHYPKWELGGNSFEIEGDEGYTGFTAVYLTEFAAQSALNQYRNVLTQNGFRQAGRYPGIYDYYKKVDGVCYHVDLEHCFDGGSERVYIIFNIQEPEGGFDYVKPEPKKSRSLLGDLLGKL